MKVNVTYLSIHKRCNDAGLGRQRVVLELMLQTAGMKHPISPYLHTARAIHQCIEQLRGNVDPLDCVGFDDLGYLIFPDKWGIRVVHLDGGVIGDPDAAMRGVDYRFTIPGPILAEWIADAPIGVEVVVPAATLRDVARRSRTRRRIVFTAPVVKERFNRCIHGPNRQSLASCVKGELAADANYGSAGGVAELQVSCDFTPDSFYFEAYTKGKRAFNGGWLLHSDGYSSHH